MQTIESAMLSDSLGREIVGVNLADPLTDDTFNAIESAFRDNPVLVFRNQSLVTLSPRCLPMHISTSRQIDPQSCSHRQ
jgi:alpha-ketoglutarate-dependent taurine dioxygenase